jgi:hypothetical protein
MLMQAIAKAQSLELKASAMSIRQTALWHHWVTNNSRWRQRTGHLSVSPTPMTVPTGNPKLWISKGSARRPGPEHPRHEVLGGLALWMPTPASDPEPQSGGRTWTGVGTLSHPLSSPLGPCSLKPHSPGDASVCMARGSPHWLPLAQMQVMWLPGCHSSMISALQSPYTYCKDWACKLVVSRWTLGLVWTRMLSQWKPLHAQLIHAERGLTQDMNQNSPEQKNF